MNRTSFLAYLAVPFMVSVSTAITAYAQDMAEQQESTTTFTCEGNMGTCFTVHNGDEIITIGGNLVEITGNDRRVCPNGGGPVGGIFLHTPGNPSTGKGYLGVKACLDPVQGERSVTVPKDARIYTTLEEWNAAQAGSSVE